MATSSEKSIFLAALEQDSPAAREQFVAEACAGNPQMRAEVEELLRASERPDNLLDAVPVEVGAVLANLEAAQGGDGGAPPGPTRNDSPIAERPGTVIGPYKLMEQIGEGGFGLVFVAEQQQPVRRKVALKVIKPGMDTRDVIARFEAERQALALMDHPCIARVFDAGVYYPAGEKGVRTLLRQPRVPERPDEGFSQKSPDPFFNDEGRPYFVMELVRGAPITEFCGNRDSALRERLELFIHVCQAVQHAHQRGIIHRDLKPSNVMTTLHDGTPVVKVIDFGIAKAIGQSLTDKTIYTRFAAMMGTPLYMSPEQAALSGLDIDTRSDIYSLGVLLYELLTGTTPFDRVRIESATFDEIRRIIREEEPPRPSSRLTTLGQALTTAIRKTNLSTLRDAFVRGDLVPSKTDPRKLSAVVRGDLDWIVMKALEKDRSRRYDTASALAADVQRFLNHEPIEARPPSPLYRFRKFARRNKAMLTTVFLVAAALVLGTAVSLWQAVRAFDERDEKEQAWKAAVQAQTEANALREQAQNFSERLKSANVFIGSARAHADESRWAAAHADYSNAVELQPDYYLAWSGRGSLYVRLGLWKLAAADYAQALRLGAPADSAELWGIPQLLLLAGDAESYRAACRTMLHGAGDDSGGVSSSVLRSLVFASTPITDPAELANRAEQLLQESSELPRGFSDKKRPPPPERHAADGRDPPDGPHRPGGPGRHKPPHDEFGWREPPSDASGRRDHPHDGPGGPSPDDHGRHGPPPDGPGRGDGPPHGPGRSSSPTRGTIRQPRGAMLYVAGLANYRAGKFEASIARLRQSLTDDPGWPGRPISYPALALAYHAASRSDEAREALTSAEQAIDQLIGSIEQGPVGTMPVPWFDWVECQILNREAHQLITGSPPAEDPRLRQIEERALAAIQNGDAAIDR